MEDGSPQGAAAVAAAAGAAHPAQRMVPAIPPLRVVALVVTTADLVAALRLLVPLVADVTPLDGGRFLLTLAGAEQGEQQAKE